MAQRPQRPQRALERGTDKNAILSLSTCFMRRGTYTYCRYRSALLYERVRVYITHTHRRCWTYLRFLLLGNTDVFGPFFILMFNLSVGSHGWSYGKVAGRYL